MKAIVLIKINNGEIKQAFEDLKRIQSLTKAYLTLGSYDVVLEIQAQNLNQIGRIVEFEILTVPGILNTCTCIMVEGNLTSGDETSETTELKERTLSPPDLVDPLEIRTGHSFGLN